MDPPEAFAITIEPLCYGRTLGHTWGGPYPRKPIRVRLRRFFSERLPEILHVEIMKQEKNVHAPRPQGICKRIVRMAGGHKETRRVAWLQHEGLGRRSEVTFLYLQ